MTKKEKERGRGKRGRIRDYILGFSLSIKTPLDHKEAQRGSPENDKTVVFLKIKACIVWC